MKKGRGTEIRIVGTREKIEATLATLAHQGFTWQSNEHFYPRRDEPGFYSYYLENFEVPQQNT